MASDANSPRAHLVQDTASMANLTPSTPFPYGIQITLCPTPVYFPHKIIAKQNGDNGPTRANHLPVHLDKT